MKYIICAPEWTHRSAGICALYKLSDDLIRLGKKSRMVTVSGYEPPFKKSIVVYPDTTNGNPLKSLNVVRYLLMHAGYFGNDTQFPDTELMYYHSKDFVLDSRSPHNILTIPITDESRFPYKAAGRSGTCYIARKYRDVFGHTVTDLPQGCIEITDYTDLSALFSNVKTLITFDNTAINLEAALAGIDVEYRFNETFKERITPGDGFDWSNPIGSYKQLKEKYYDQQLPQFISNTQERFS